MDNSKPLFKNTNGTAEIKVSSATYDRIYAVLGAVGVCEPLPRNTGYSVDLKQLQTIISGDTTSNVVFFIPKDQIMKNLNSALSSEFKKNRSKVSENLQGIDFLVVRE
ncbi:hypothetical protein [Photobacterium damselae]|uniref:hypothetical protein n=1 Tax=Photobacterium damselae TaxID=38293 RepID=UPI001F16C5CA|nr:hypothetical protein [Photobacterium damselae]UKA04998.1 hypothetical protein IHC89_22390 [Photobacterium damselae subsp. damselae]